LDAQKEAALLCAIKTPEDYFLASSLGITDNHFQQEQGYRDVWEFYGRYVRDFNKIPPLELTQKNYTKFVPSDSYGEVKYEVQNLHQAYLSRSAYGIIQDNLKDTVTDPTAAVVRIIDGLQKIKISLNERSGFLNDDDVYEAVEARYKKMLEGGGDPFSGIATGIEPIDITGQGLQKGEVMGIIARPGIGKTALLVEMAVSAWERGYRVLFVSPEMSTEHIALRAHVVIANRLGLTDFPTYSDLMMGRMADGKLEAYKAFGSTGIDDRWLTLELQEHGALLDVPQIASQALHHRADLIIIDGVTFIADSQRSSTLFEKVTNVVQDTKTLCTDRGISAVLSQHAKPGAITKLTDMPNLQDVYMGDKIAQVSERVLASGVVSSGSNAPDAHAVEEP
jgi:archaellum biogenesis ATPase FlaH